MMEMNAGGIDPPVFTEQARQLFRQLLDERKSERTANEVTNHPRYSRAYRDRQRGGPPRQLAPCGTRAAAARHRRRGEPLDAACVDAERAYQREIARRRRKGT